LTENATIHRSHSASRGISISPARIAARCPTSRPRHRKQSLIVSSDIALSLSCHDLSQAKVSTNDSPVIYARFSTDLQNEKSTEDQIASRVKSLRSEKARLHTNVKRRPAHLLSGLLRCGCCGSGMSVHDRGKTRMTRIRCSAVRESGAAPTEGLFISAMSRRPCSAGCVLKDPRLIGSYARKYRQRLAAAATATRTRLESKRDRIESERQRNIDMVIKE
jgi:Recombinase zinc beta ribbon domain